MRYFLDTEFRDDGKGAIEFISIGVVAEDGRTYSAISSEFDLKAVLNDPWLSKNVWPHIKLDYEHGNTKTLREIASDLLEFFDEKHNLPAEIYRLLPPDSPAESEVWGINCAYDWVVVKRLFGRMIDSPPGFPRRMRDIRDYQHFLGVFDIPRVSAGDAHESLADAYEVKDAFDFLQAYRYNASI